MAVRKKVNTKVLLFFAVCFVFLMSLLRVKDLFFVYLITLLVIAINTIMGFASSRVRGVNIEIFGLGTILIAIFYKGIFGVIFLVFMLLPYFFFSGFNVWAIPYFGGSIISFLVLNLFRLSANFPTLVMGIILTNIFTYFFFAFFHGNLFRPLKDTAISIFLNIFILNMVYPLLSLGL